MQDRRSNFEYEDLLACGRGELFAQGPQLPLPPMLMFDRISEIAEVGGEYGKGLVRAVLDLKPDLWFFPCHFKGDPVMPGCLGIDALWQLLGFFLGWAGSPGKGRALGMGEIKFSGQVLPTMKNIVYGIDIKRVMRSKLVLGIADGWLSADGNVILSAVAIGPRRWIRAVFMRTRDTRSSPFSVLTITATTASMKPIRICGASPRPNRMMKSG